MSDKFSIAKTYEALGGQSRIKRQSGHAEALCLLHDERNPSMSLNLNEQLWKCFKCDVGGDAVSLVMRVQFPQLDGKEAYRAAFAFLRSNGIEGGDAARPRGFYAEASTPRAPLSNEQRMVFTFLDRNGKPLYDEIRLEGENENGEREKRPLMRRRLPPGRWLHTGNSYRYYDQAGDLVPWGPEDPSPIELPRFYRDGTPAREPRSPYLYQLRGVERVLYNLPEVRLTAAQGGILTFPEGLKKSAALKRRTGLTVTTVAGGAHGELRPQMLEDVDGAAGMLMLADSDEEGYASAMERALFFSRVVPDVRVIDFYGDNSSRDVEDWLNDLGRANADTIVARLQHLADMASRIQPGGIDCSPGPFPTICRRQPALARGGSHR